MNTTQVGDVAHAMVLASLVRSGERVLVPFSEDCRYDLALDRDGELKRVQVKTGRLQDGAVCFNAYSVGRDRVARRYVGEVDFFGVYCAELNQVYLVPIDGLGKEPRLRVEACKSGRQKGVRWAADYMPSYPNW